MDIELPHDPGPDPNTEKERLLLRFRTITTLLSVLEVVLAPGSQTMKRPPDKQDIRDLRLLTALATLLVTEHEIAALIVREPGFGKVLEILSALELNSERKSRLDPSLFPRDVVALANPQLDAPHDFTDDTAAIAGARVDVLAVDLSSCDIDILDPFKYILRSS
jgi:hypothetical protein